MPSVVTGAVLDAPDPVYPPSETPDVESHGQFFGDLFQLIRRHLRPAVSEVTVTFVSTESSRVHSFSPSISSLELITEQSIYSHDLDTFLAYSPSLESRGHVVFGLRRAQLPDPEWEY